MSTTSPICRLEEITLAHAPFVQQYAANRLIADTTASIPHPYPAGAAQQFITHAITERTNRAAFVYAICTQQEFVGVASLFRFDWPQFTAEVGYWIAVPFWGRGYATQAVVQLLTKAAALHLRTVIGKCLVRNPASRRVLEKNGFTLTGESVGCGQHRDDPVWVLERGAR